MSFTVCLKPPKMGGNILIVSIATLQVYFILPRSSQVSDSPGNLLCAISSCSAFPQSLLRRNPKDKSNSSLNDILRGSYL